MLESLYERFNLDPPRDFTGHSLSVSDVVGLKGKSGVSFHYVDSFGFAELPAFLPAPDRAMEEASRAAELAGARVVRCARGGGERTRLKWLLCARSAGAAEVVCIAAFAAVASTNLLFQGL